MASTRPYPGSNRGTAEHQSRKPPGRAPIGTYTNDGHDTHSFWVTQLSSAKNQWILFDRPREEIRKVISELAFPQLLLKNEVGGRPSEQTVDRLRLRFPHLQQLELNLPLRYVQKLTSSIGDEEPEQKWTRDWTQPWNEVAHLWDILITRTMSQAGAPENNAASAADACSDGASSFWVGFEYELTGDDLERSTLGMDGLIEEILQDPVGYEPAEGADHEMIAEVLEKRAFDEGLRLKDPNAAVSLALVNAAAAHYEMAAKDEKTLWRWQSGVNRLTHERLPLGTHVLMDPVAGSFRQARWVARMLRMPVEDARKHPAFHPGIRSRLQADELLDPVLRRESTIFWQGETSEEMKDRVGLCTIWQIHDRKTKQIIYLNPGIDRFLNAGDRAGVSRMRHPFLDQKGKPLIPAMKHHPGFFPCDIITPQVPRRDDLQKKFGKPLLQVGMPLIYAIVKTLSHYYMALKRASSAIYEGHPKLSPSARRAIKQAIDGTIFTRPPDVEPGGSLQLVQFKPPGEELYRFIQDLVANWCVVQSFPLAELTTVAQSDTATQEEIGIASGNVWWGEIVRKWEVSYGVQCCIAGHLMAYFADKGDWASKIGLTAANKLHSVVSNTRIPPEPPMIRFSSKMRDSNPVRVKQLMDYDERLATYVDPALGIPIYDRGQIYEEVNRVLNLGELQRYNPNIEHLKMIAEAKGRMLAEQMMQGGAGDNPPARADTKQNGNGQAQPTSPVDQRPAVGGSPGGSASQKRTGEEAGASKRGRRGGRRGRSESPTSRGTEMGQAVDTGPV